MSRKKLVYIKSYKDEAGNLIDVYEEEQTGRRHEKVMADDDGIKVDKWRETDNNE